MVPLVCLLITSLLMPATLHAGITKADILESMRHKYQSLKGLKADYQRSTKSIAMESVFKSNTYTKASGVLEFKKPNMLRLDQDKPSPEKFITNGKIVWWYIPDEYTVHRYTGIDLIGELKPLLDFLNGLSDLTGEYRVNLIPADGLKENTHTLELIPQNSSATQKITLYLNSSSFMLTGFSFTSILGEVTIFTLKNTTLPTNTPDSRFIFKVPEDVRVIDKHSE